MSRVNKTGRSNGSGRYAQVHHYLMNSAAWLSLRPAERAVWLEIAKLYNGANNGYLALSVRTAAERCNINKDTAKVAFDRLEERGFIECTEEGGFSRKVRHSREWRLTHLRCDRTHQLPSKAFLHWRPPSLVDI